MITLRRILVGELESYTTRGGVGLSGAAVGEGSTSLVGSAVGLVGGIASTVGVIAGRGVGVGASSEYVFD
jgi:hypothetical protein